MAKPATTYESAVEIREALGSMTEVLQQIRDVLEELGGSVTAIASELERMRQESRHGST